MKKKSLDLYIVVAGRVEKLHVSPHLLRYENYDGLRRVDESPDKQDDVICMITRRGMYSCVIPGTIIYSIKYYILILYQVMLNFRKPGRSPPNVRNVPIGAEAVTINSPINVDARRRERTSEHSHRLTKPADSGERLSVELSDCVVKSPSNERRLCEYIGQVLLSSARFYILVPSHVGRSTSEPSSLQK